MASAATVKQALRQIWGYNEFRPLQAESVDQILGKQDSLTVLPTGGGKSLCYQLPSAIMEGTAIVVSPLISLMADQVQALDLLGVPAAFLNSSQKVAEVKRNKSRFFRGELKLLYVSPERLLMDHFLEEIGQVALSFLAIDEAHCISQWGHDFRPEYTQLKQVRHRYPELSFHAFTATAPPAVQEEIVRELGLRKPMVFVGNYHRANLYYRVQRRNKLRQQVLDVVKAHRPKDNGIIYCLTRKETEATAEFLCKEGFKALPYHAGLEQEQRRKNQEKFSQEKVQIICATVAFGMGIDQSNVRYVVHAGMPRSLAHYQQESGRAGRDGLPARCILIYSANDIAFWKRIIEEEGARLHGPRMAQLQDMIQYCNRLRCRHRMLVEYFGQEFEKENCGTCDVCQGDLECIPDVRMVAKKILSAVLKTGESFGAAYVSQVLTGSKDAKIERYGHDRISVYDLLHGHSQHQVHDWIEQLENQNYLRREMGEYPVIKLTSQGYWLLRPEKFGKNDDDLPLVLLETRKKAEQAKRKPTAVAVTTLDGQLFEKLRQKRTELASALGVPAFVVFGDRSLEDMSRKKPKTTEEFLQVFGVGDHKMRQFGQAMLAVIAEHMASK